MVDIRSLDEARQYDDGVVYLMAGDDALLVVAPARLVGASEQELDELGEDLQSLRWSGRVPTRWRWGAVYYDRIPVGQRVFGLGYGQPSPSFGVIVSDQIWVSREFDRHRIAEVVREVVSGLRSRLPLP